MNSSPVALSELLSRATSDTSAAPDATAERIIDAAVAESAAVGLDRLRMEDVVRRSGLGRTTVYRRFPTRDELVRALATRETRRFLSAVSAGIDSVEAPSERVVEAFVAAVSFARKHPMMRRMAETAPGSVVDLAHAPDAELFAAGTAFITRQLHGANPGEPSREARWVADVFARLFLTYLALPPVDPDVRDDTELRAFAQAVLIPMAERVTPS
ncbi:TetR/AcrR family transcriptional regulator [Nocardia bovistercoris]|uniref:TetR/AcrR family transcriptional regulator n=1 Tax=Nocardia bovistercoris TaxID=2785916 RepID=A0A931IF65_9NOCA|nr:TetR/AcrR family transcriptional regulator [Nocardia bovistercoris]MBH0779250.1 TetR/AcrR family transcriptional regulator [Nocardia bovistercoris]